MDIKTCTLLRRPGALIMWYLAGNFWRLKAAKLRRKGMYEEAIAMLGWRDYATQIKIHFPNDDASDSYLRRKYMGLMVTTANGSSMFVSHYMMQGIRQFCLIRSKKHSE